MKKHRSILIFALVVFTLGCGCSQDITNLEFDYNLKSAKVIETNNEFGLELLKTVFEAEEEAQDIMQDGFIKVFAKLDQVKNPAALPGWIRRVMINTALERYRSQVLLQRVDEVREEHREEAGNEALDKLSCDELVGLIQTLTPRYRMVFNLYAIEGFTHQEISEELGISIGTSKSNLSRARAILQKKIKTIYGSAIVR